MYSQFWPFAPRAADDDELGAVYDYAERAFDVDRSDAQGIIDASHIGVFEQGHMLIPGYTGKVMMVIMGGTPNTVCLLRWQDDELTLARQYVEA